MTCFGGDYWAEWTQIPNLFSRQASLVHHLPPLRRTMDLHLTKVTLPKQRQRVLAMKNVPICPRMKVTGRKERRTTRPQEDQETLEKQKNRKLP